MARQRSDRSADVGLERLAEDHQRYFESHPDARLVPVTRVLPREPASSEPASVDRAENLMRDAAAGRIPRRPPIAVRRRGGAFEIVEGNATFAVAERHRWRFIPALIEDPAQ